MTTILPFVAVGAAIAGVGYLIYQNWDKIAPVLSAVGDAILAVVGPPVQAMFASISATLSDLWNGPFGNMLVKAWDLLKQFGAWLVDVFVKTLIAEWNILGPTIKGALAIITTAISTAFSLIGDSLNFIGALLTGDFAGAWDAAKNFVVHAVTGFWSIIDTMFPGIIGWMQSLYDGIRTWIVDRLNAVWQGVIAKITTVKDAFFNLYDAVVGHSYVPDMVDEIGQHMARLDQLLVGRAQDVTESAAEKFRRLQQEAKDLFDRLFPEQARWNKFKTEFDHLTEMAKQGVKSADEVAAARTRLVREFNDIPLAGIGGLAAEIPETAIQPVMTDDEMERVLSGVNGMADGVEAANVRIVQSFADMAKGAVSELQNLVNGIKSGSVLDILSAVIGLLDKVGGIFGGIKLGSITFGQPKVAGARASGGPVFGGKTYLVGERGPELFTASQSGRIISNDNLRGGSTNVQVIPSPMFDVVVDGKVVRGSMAAAQAGSQGAQVALARRANYTL
jgi:hypothetical protein